MDIYHCYQSRSLRPLWTLEELGMPYTLHDLPFPPRARAQGYLDLNPLGTVPCLVDGATRMTESSGMCLYLVERYERYELGLTRDHPEYGDYLNWLFHSDATLTFPQTIVLRYGSMEPPERRLPQAADDYRKWYLARLRLLNRHIEGREFLCDGRFTIADICIGYALFLGMNPHIDVAGSYAPAVRDYIERLMQRPAFQRVVTLGAPVADVGTR